MIDRIPTPVIRSVGRSPLAPVAARLARSVARDDDVVRRGAATGLRFNAGPNAPIGLRLGTWEPETQALLTHELRSGDVVWDVGAATGFFTLIAARLVGAGGSVVAFEPAPQNISYLRVNVEVNALQNVKIVEAAAAETEGFAVLVPQAEDEVSLSIRRVDAPGEATIRITTLDAACSEYPAPSWLKIDVEGVEIETLQGGRALIERVRPTLLIEVHERWEQLQALIDDLGYDWSGIDIVDPADADHAVHVLCKARA